jgi:glycyl-tRNA synthetase beta chain
MNKVIFEIGTEEIPSTYIDKALIDLKNITINYLKTYNIGYGNIYTYGTPRRLVVYIIDIEKQQKNIIKKVKGPAKNISFDEQGNPQKPAIKFARVNNIKVEELTVENTKKGNYVFAKTVIKGEKIEKLLPDIFLKIITELNFPKSMRWGGGSFRFIRPIRWLLALYNEKIIDFNLENIKAGNQTYGHRLLSPKTMKVNTPDEYFSKMNSCFVVIQPEERKKIILDQIKAGINRISGKENIDISLLDDVKNLIEFPRVLLGKFNKSYLELPPEVLKAVMVKHQKYFPAYSKDNSLLPYFFVVINGNDDKYKENIVRGNERVLKARLEDARFFYLEDQKVYNKKTKPLDNNLKKLNDVVYQENLGSMLKKVERIIALSQKIGITIKLESNVLKYLKRAAQLCKSDLVTEMVKEFPELQGIMGKEYALLQGEDKQVAEGIFEHYLPRTSFDNLPKTIIGKVLSISDKLDNITACFLNNNVPDGSQDPYALRRQALGIINIILSSKDKIDIPLYDIIGYSVKILKDNSNLTNNIDNNKIIYEIKDFILQRLRFMLIEKGYKYDILDSVLTRSPDTLNDALLRIKIIQDIYNLPRFNKIITAATRTYNLSKNSKINTINRKYFTEKEEINLYNYYIAINDKIEMAISKKEYDKVFDYLETIAEPINTFFDNVLVMEKDEKIRNNRLALLIKITEMYYNLADLSKIALAKGNFDIK